MSALERLTEIVGENREAIALGIGGALAGAVRLAAYAGPPRPWRVVLMDAAIMSVTGLAVAQIVYGLTGSMHVGMGAGIVSGVVGWEAIKRAVLAWLNKQGTP